MTQKHKVYFSTEKELGSDNFTIKEIKQHSVGGIKLNGNYSFFLNVCPHANAPICKGTIQPVIIAKNHNQYGIDESQKILRCPWHGMEFDVSSGRALASDEYKLVKINFTTEGGKIFIFI